MGTKGSARKRWSTKQEVKSFHRTPSLHRAKSHTFLTCARAWWPETPKGEILANGHATVGLVGGLSRRRRGRGGENARVRDERGLRVGERKGGLRIEKRV